MTRITVDDVLRIKLLDLSSPLELCDVDGRVLARVVPVESAVFVPAEPQVSREELYTNKITDADLLLCPKWNQGAESPPISARKALDLATKMKDSLVKDGQRYKWLLASLELKPTRLGQWVWVARYRPIFWFGYVATDPDQLAIVVMMDGTVIKSKVSDLKYAEPDDGEPREGEPAEGEKETRRAARPTS